MYNERDTWVQHSLKFQADINMLPKNKNQISLTCNHKHFSATIMEFKKNKTKKKSKNTWYSENCTCLKKPFTRIAKLLQKDPKTLI